MQFLDGKLRAQRDIEAHPAICDVEALQRRDLAEVAPDFHDVVGRQRTQHDARLDHAAEEIGFGRDPQLHVAAGLGSCGFRRGGRLLVVPAIVSLRRRRAGLGLDHGEEVAECGDAGGCVCLGGRRRSGNGWRSRRGCGHRYGRRSLRLLADLLEGGEKIGPLDRLFIVARSRHQIGDSVGAAQEQRERRVLDRDTAGAQMVERRLEDMGEGDELGAAEGARSALDRMDGAKGRIDVFGVVGALVESLELLLQRSEELLALLEEGLLEFCQRIHRPAFSSGSARRGRAGYLARRA